MPCHGLESPERGQEIRQIVTLLLGTFSVSHGAAVASAFLEPWPTLTGSLLTALSRFTERGEEI